MDTVQGKPVAIKMARPGNRMSGEVLQRFLQEPRILTRLDHPNILPVLGEGVVRGRPWFACAYAARGSLSQRLVRDGRPIPLEEMLRYAAEVLDALVHIHALGIVHRDVKPENILTDDDDVAMLCDFGIAQTPERRATLVGDQMGTPYFMSPEQAVDASSVTPRSDLFGLGMTMYVCLTGRSAMPLWVEHLRPTALRWLDPRVRGLVARATALREEDRFQDALEMGLAVAEVLDEL